MSQSARKLKVLLLTSSMTHGGAQRYLSILLDNLDRSMFVPEIATVLERDVEYHIPADATLWNVAQEPRVEPPVDLGIPSEVIDMCSDQAASAQMVVDEIAHLVCRIRPDVVLSTPEWVSVEAAAASSRFPAETRLICRVGAPPSIAFPPVGDTYLYSVLARAHYGTVDCMMANSEAIARDLVANFGVDASRIAVVHNPLDVTRAQALGSEPVTEVPFEDGVPTVVFVGRMNRIKGLGYLLSAMAQVVKVRAARCVLVGGGAQADYLRALAKHLGIDGQVCFVGPQDNPFRFMSKATAFVLPSLSEGMPNVLLEAMACGCPVIATDIEGGVTRELLRDGDCGIIVPRADADALAEAILRLLGDDALRDRLTNRGIDRVTEFDLPSTIGACERLMLEMVAADEAVDPAAPCDAGPDAAESERIAESQRSQSPAQTAALASLPTAPAVLPRSRLGNAARILRDHGPMVLALRALQLLHLVKPPADQVRLDEQAARIEEWAARRGQGRIGLMVCVTTADDVTARSVPEALLRNIDRNLFDVCLVRVFDEPGSGGVFDSVDQFVIVPDRGLAPVVDRGVPEVVALRHQGELEWVAARARGLSALAEGLSVDAIMAQDFYTSIIAAMSTQDLPRGVVTLAEMHSRAQDFVCASGVLELYGALLSAYLSRADVAVAPTESIRSDMVEKLGVRPDAAVVIPDPIEVRQPIAAGSDLAAAGEAVKQPAVFRVAGARGPSVAIESLFEALALARREEDVRLVVEGADSDAGLTEASTRFGTRDAVIVVRELEMSRRPSDGALGCVYIGAQDDVGVPDALVQAVAAGLAVISVGPSTCVREFLGAGERGVLVPGGEPQELAEAILRLVWDDDARRVMVRKAAEYLASASADRVVGRLEALVRATVAGRDEGSSGIEQDEGTV